MRPPPFLYKVLYSGAMDSQVSSMPNNEAGPSKVTTISRIDSQVVRRASSVPLVPDNYAVGYVYSSEMMIHFSPHGHPEQPARIQEIWRTLVQDQLTKSMKWIPIREVRRDEALLIHSEDHWDKVLAIQCKYANTTMLFYQVAEQVHLQY